MGKIESQSIQSDAIQPSLMFGEVMHRRLFPKVNGFKYGIYYLALPLSQVKNIKNLKINKFSALSFHTKDHAARKGDNLEQWARDILAQYKIDKADGDIILIALPRIFGYVFNPISYWMCLDKNQNLRAVICEVNNTFGQTHSYLCAHEDQRSIDNKDWLRSDKIFHVSPFLQRTGEYKFRFDWRPDDPKGVKFGSWVDYYDENGEKQLITSLIGRFSPLDKSQLRRAFWGYPLVTFKAITLIHWQALKLVAKKIKYVPKPAQKEEKLSATDNLTKM